MILSEAYKKMIEIKVKTFNQKGEKLIGLEDLPIKKKRKYPTVILAHGFSAEKEEYGMFDEIAEDLAKNDFLVYRFDFSGCGESEGDYSKTSLIKLVSDLRSILDFVKKQKKVDKKKIGLLGMSFGTSVEIALNAKEIKSLVLLGSIARPYKVLKNLFGKGFNSKGISVRIKSRGQKTEMGSQFWKDLKKYNLIEKIKKVKVPICFIHGEKDSKAPLEEAKLFYKNANQPKMLIIIKNAEHGFYRTKERAKMMKEATNWFIKYLS